MSVCKYWRRALASDAVWKSLFDQEFGQALRGFAALGRRGRGSFSPLEDAAPAGPPHPPPAKAAAVPGPARGDEPAGPAPAAADGAWLARFRGLMAAEGAAHCLRASRLLTLSRKAEFFELRLEGWDGTQQPVEPDLRISAHAQDVRWWDQSVWIYFSFTAETSKQIRESAERLNLYVEAVVYLGDPTDDEAVTRYSCISKSDFKVPSGEMENALQSHRTGLYLYDEPDEDGGDGTILKCTAYMHMQQLAEVLDGRAGPLGLPFPLLPVLDRARAGWTRHRSNPLVKELTLYCSFNCVDTAECAGQIRCKLKLEAGTPRRLLYSSEAMTVGEGAFWDIVHQAGASLDFALYEGERLLLGRSGVEIWGHVTGAVDDPAHVQVFKAPFLVDGLQSPFSAHEVHFVTSAMKDVATARKQAVHLKLSVAAMLVML